MKRLNQRVYPKVNSSKFNHSYNKDGSITINTIHTSHSDNIGSINKEYQYGSVAGDDVTYLDNDGSWLSGDQGYSMLDRNNAFKVKATFKKPYILTEDKISDISNRTKNGTNISDSLKRDGYDGIIIDVDDSKIVDNMKESHYKGGNTYSKDVINLLQNQVIAFYPEKQLKEVGRVDVSKIRDARRKASGNSELERKYTRKEIDKLFGDFIAKNNQDW